MNDSVESPNSAPDAHLDSPSAPPGDAPPWLLLIHHLPPKPDYLRVKVRRRLDRLGALAVKSSVYVLPNSVDTVEDFQWLAREIEADGGEAILCTASFLSGISDRDLVDAFQAARASDYRAIAVAAGAIETGDSALSRLERRFASVTAIDHLGSPARVKAEHEIKAAAGRARGGMKGSPATEVPRTLATGASTDAAMLGRTWVTRTGVFVDRIASAWLIRRFIDSEARFAFVASARYRPKPGETRFDMFDAEFTHEGDRCTFETLLARFGLSDHALTVLGEIVHDIDLKDEKYGRPETSGVAAVLAGIAATTTDDALRIERGAALFDGLHATLGGSSEGSSR